VTKRQGDKVTKRKTCGGISKTFGCGANNRRCLDYARHDKKRGRMGNEETCDKVNPCGGEISNIAVEPRHASAQRGIWWKTNSPVGVDGLKFVKTLIANRIPNHRVLRCG